MTQARLISDLINWGINAAFIAALLFPFVVRTYWAWEKSDWGINIVSLELLIALALLPLWVRHITGYGGNMYFYGWLEAASLWGIPVIILWRAIIIWRNQRYKLAEKNGDNGSKEEEKVP
jgi:hypothetical protein